MAQKFIEYEKRCWKECKSTAAAAVIYKNKTKSLFKGLS
jgi:hypothetical protein